VQGADLLAALPSVQRNAILKNARETGLKEFSINYPGADGKPVKGTVVLGEPPQAQEEGKASSSPSRLRADTDVAQKVANAQDALDRLRQEAQQVGPPKGMGQYVGDVKGALEAAGVRGEVGTEAEARIRENLGRIDDDKRFALGMSIAQAGFAAAAAKSPYALANIAEGFGIGVKQYTSAMADIKKAQREEQKALTEIEAARRGEKLKIGTTAYEQRQKDIADAQKRYDDAQRAVATGSIQLANIVLDASTANVRTDVMRDQNLITQLNNLGIKEDAQRIAILKEAGERAHKMLAAVISPTPQKEEEIRRKAFESVIAESKALNIGVASGAQVPTASAAPARKPGFEVVGVR
jgi:ATP:corrinoid adenosyltransferase